MKEIEKFGRQVILKYCVKNIVRSDSKVKGVILSNGNRCFAKKIISNSDINYTLQTLLNVSPKSSPMKCLNKFKPSQSIFITYVLLKKRISDMYKYAPGLWCLLDNKIIDEEINKESQGVMLNNSFFISFASKLDASLSPPGRDYLRIMINASYESKEFWRKYSKKLSVNLVNAAAKLLPSLRDDSIDCFGRASPITMSNYTYNSNGSVAGWLNNSTQIQDPITNHLPNISGLFFAGHWVTQAYGNGGVAMAADSGRRAAKKVLASER